VHTTATFLVAFGTTMSAFWIIVLNSWMHTPQGFELRDGIVHATDWWAIVFNPSMPYRLTHMLLASGLTVAFLLAGISALRLLLKDRAEGTKSTVRTGIILAAVLIPLQIVAGDMHGLNTLEHQPQKVAAMEANWETSPRVPLVLFAMPNEETRSNDYEIAIPYLASIILKHDPQGIVPGLNDFVLADGTVMHPPVAPVFWAFRIMVGVGFLMLATSWLGSYLLWKRGVDRMPKLYLVGMSGMAFMGWVATLAGWYTTEIGRQPWLVDGVLTTAEAVSPVAAPMVLTTLIAYLVVYAALMLAYMGVITYMARKAAKGETLPPDPRGREPGLVPAE
ncbi:MAG: cytochrome ubiquinol oxidase subunit I, partial [Paracoccaceae bacterium]